MAWQDWVMTATCDKCGVEYPAKHCMTIEGSTYCYGCNPNSSIFNNGPKEDEKEGGKDGILQEPS